MIILDVDTYILNDYCYSYWMFVCMQSLDVLLCVVFFKQKTAYEMRISDWSSDVCSSDLLSRLPGTQPEADPVQDAGRPTCDRHYPDGKFRDVEIGRASCRERV